MELHELWGGVSLLPLGHRNVFYQTENGSKVRSINCHKGLHRGPFSCYNYSIDTELP
ncbi:hypothetical protein SSSM5_005 [Synechococcus phage S-SSM5]|uniref:Uncharacterized protein n=1 Tax=Synechococcus phage S-SSM5 TaxID=445685 RepID=E3SK48_9CAUD|nr:hypothetical protein SSSM5_005 [Synechococcus phage S-SSM5]ADO98062.1 hypothetical protein SSSM5_005 [Synechococcus phage S-SSM5]